MQFFIFPLFFNTIFLKSINDNYYNKTISAFVVSNTMEPRVWVCGLCRVRNLLPCWITGSSNSVIPNHRVAVRYRFVDQLAPTHGRNNHLCPYFSFDSRQSFISKNILFWKITEFFQLHLDLWSLVKWAKWRRLNDLLFWKTLVLKIEMILSVTFYEGTVHINTFPSL